MDEKVRVFYYHRDTDQIGEGLMTIAEYQKLVDELPAWDFAGFYPLEVPYIEAYNRFNDFVMDHIAAEARCSDDLLNAGDYYLNTGTGELATQRTVFREWLRDGEGAQVFRKGKLVLTFNPDPLLAGFSAVG